MKLLTLTVESPVCPDCGGRGQAQHEPLRVNADCHLCHGTGVLPADVTGANPVCYRCLVAPTETLTVSAGDVCPRCRGHGRVPTVGGSIPADVRVQGGLPVYEEDHL